MRKYIIEVSKEGIKKTFINDDKKYEETWVRDENGNSRTLETGITAQLDQYGDFEEELIELLDEDNINGLWDYFEENKDIEKRGKLIKNLATCSKCKIDLLSKYEDGIWGFSRIFRDENNKFYTKCPLCENEEKYFIDENDIKEIYKPKENMI